MVSPDQCQIGLFVAFDIVAGLVGIVAGTIKYIWVHDRTDRTKCDLSASAPLVIALVMSPILLIIAQWFLFSGLCCSILKSNGDSQQNKARFLFVITWVLFALEEALLWTGVSTLVKTNSEKPCQSFTSFSSIIGGVVTTVHAFSGYHYLRIATKVVHPTRG
ncbi:unnamed protein product [Cuscuta europaea]|uniref:Uncharacterized protein n=1 Tax=Cuscuta europaea TaxID=41803 RepID=A0A9P0ZL44_CUSEU|nr:unnamed protein product [Cuscuta europaea]